MSFGTFGQGARAEGPGMLGDFVDDIRNDLQANAQTFATSMANSAYDQVMQRFNAEKDEIVGGVIASAKPRVLEILDDADTKARIGQAQASFRNSLIVGAFATAILTSFGTFALIRTIK